MMFAWLYKVPGVKWVADWFGRRFGPIGGE